MQTPPLENLKMEKHFRDLKEIIEQAQSNNAPQESELVLVGQILYAQMRGDLTIDESLELEEMLDLPDNAQQIIEFAMFGDDDEYQDEIRGQDGEGA